MRDIKKTIESIITQYKGPITPSNIKQVEDDVNFQMMAAFHNPNYSIQVELGCLSKGNVTIEKLLVFDDKGNVIDPRELAKRFKK